MHMSNEVLPFASTVLRTVRSVVRASGLLLTIVILATSAQATTRRIVAQTELDIQSAIDSLPDSGGTVIVSSPEGKSVLVRNSIVINKDNVTLRGDGITLLRLADGAQ